MTATTYVRADKDELVVDVTGADQHDADRSHQSSDRPEPDGGCRWSDRDDSRRRGWTRAASPAAPARRSAASPRSRPAAARVAARVVDARTNEVSFKPNADGTFRVIVGSPTWAGGDAAGHERDSCSATTRPPPTCAALMSSGGRSYWAKVGLIRLQSTDGTADYMENLRTIFLYVAGRDGAQHVPVRPGRHAPAVQLQP